MIACAVTDLPLPDSPSTATVSPRLIWKLTPSRGRAVPALVSNSTLDRVRRVTDRQTCRGGVRMRVGSDSSEAPQFRVESVPEGVAEDSESQHEQCQRHTGESGDPPRVTEVTATV